MVQKVWASSDIMKKYVAGFSGFLVEKFVKSVAVSIVQIKSSATLSGADES